MRFMIPTKKYLTTKLTNISKFVITNITTFSLYGENYKNFTERNEGM